MIKVEYGKNEVKWLKRKWNRWCLKTNRTRYWFCAEPWCFRWFVYDWACSKHQYCETCDHYYAICDKNENKCC